LHKAKGSNRLRTACRRAQRPAWLLQLRRATVHNARANDGIIFPGDDLSLARVGPRHRLAGHPGEGADLSFQGCRIGRELDEAAAADLQ
jgi:hypothetical protein